MIKEIENKIKAVLGELGISGVSFVVEYPTDKHTGADYFSNVALVVSKQLGVSPQEAAKKIQESLEGTLEEIKTIEVAGPGF